MNLFGTVLTYVAPSANYRGESPLGEAVIQKITRGRHDYAIVSPEAMRNALRETLRASGLPCNRTRLEDEEQLMVKFDFYPDADRFADDFFMGWLIATGDRDKHRAKVVASDTDQRGNDLRPELQRLDDKLRELREKEGRKEEEEKKAKTEIKKTETQRSGLLTRVPLQFKRDSVLRMNVAVALEPYRHNTVFTQSPMQSTESPFPEKDSPWQNTGTSVLLRRQTTFTAFQYPFALNLEDCRPKADWTKILLRAIGELNDVAGNHARSYFEFSPASIVIRVTPRLVAGHDTYGFRITEDGKHTLPEVIDGILRDDYPGSEFYLGGKLVKDMGEDAVKALEAKTAKLFRSPQKLLEQVGTDSFAETRKGK
jgi:CRISPR-associated protein Cst2